MRFRRVASACALVFVVLAAGCQSTRAHRIRENAALFASLDPFTQKLITDGLFDHGFTPEMLYLSLGKPNHVVVSETDRGRVEIWSYRNFLYGSESAVKVAGAVIPGAKPGGTVISSSAPGGPSLMSTKASPGQAVLPDVNDTTLGTLYVELLDGRVTAARVVP
jgi:hypothetical protein